MAKRKFSEHNEVVKKTNFMEKKNSLTIEPSVFEQMQKNLKKP